MTREYMCVSCGVETTAGARQDAKDRGLSVVVCNECVDRDREALDSYQQIVAEKRMRKAS